VLGWLDLSAATLFLGCDTPDIRPGEARELLRGTPWDVLVGQMRDPDLWWFETKGA
jgi:hypothetical protein